MKVKFILLPPGRPEYKIGDIVEFTGPIPEGYARKYIARGWAEDCSDPVVPVEEGRPTPSVSSRRTANQSSPAQSSFGETANKKAGE